MSISWTLLTVAMIKGYRVVSKYSEQSVCRVTQTHLRSQAAITWHTLESRVAGKDKEYALLRVLPLIATVERRPEVSVTPETARLIARLFEDLSDRSMQLPGEVREMVD